jgi:hypothetical protein
VLARRLVKRYESALAAARPASWSTGIDHELVRKVAGWERQDAKETAPRRTSSA